jgi:hypothetical protein
MDQRVGKVKFTRHAKRRIKLYGLSEDIVCRILLERDLESGHHEIIRKTDQHRYPIKVIFSRDADILTVISAYPLKKGLPQ